jgi:hypothetical protein
VSCCQVLCLTLFTAARADQNIGFNNNNNKNIAAMDKSYQTNAWFLQSRTFQGRNPSFPGVTGWFVFPCTKLKKTSSKWFCPFLKGSPGNIKKYKGFPALDLGVPRFQDISRYSRVVRTMQMGGNSYRKWVLLYLYTDRFPVNIPIWIWIRK